MFFPKMTECLSVVLKMISVRNKVMKRVLFILILLTCGINVLSAQDISVKSFRLLPTDLTARVDPVTNDNGQSCALVKIVTTERGFEFDPDALGMCGAVDESHAGEVRIWLSPGSRRITIRHKSLGVLRGYEYPEEIKSALYEADDLLSGDGGIVEKLKSASHSIDSVKDVFHDITEAAERIESSFIELKDIADEVARHAEHIEFDPARMEEVNNRLDTIYHLQQKFHVDSVTQLISLREDFGQQLSQIDGGDEALHEMEEKEAALRTVCEEKAKRLTAIRK